MLARLFNVPHPLPIPPQQRRTKLVIPRPRPITRQSRRTPRRESSQARFVRSALHGRKRLCISALSRHHPPYRRNDTSTGPRRNRRLPHRGPDRDHETNREETRCSHHGLSRRLMQQQHGPRDRTSGASGTENACTTPAPSAVPAAAPSATAEREDGAETEFGDVVE